MQRPNSPSPLPDASSRRRPPGRRPRPGPCATTSCSPPMGRQKRARRMSNPGRQPTTPNRPRRRRPPRPGATQRPLAAVTSMGFRSSFAAGRTSLLNVAVTDIVACTPAGSFPDVDQLVIPQVTVQPNGSFSGTGTQQGVFDNAKAKFTYSLPGTSRARPQADL